MKTLLESVRDSVGARKLFRAGERILVAVSGGADSVVLLAGITVALILLFIELKDHALPILDETTGTLNRVRGTANFMSEEAVKPIMTVAGKAAKVRAMSRVIAGKQKTPPMG